VRVLLDPDLASTYLGPTDDVHALSPLQNPNVVAVPVELTACQVIVLLGELIWSHVMVTDVNVLDTSILPLHCGSWTPDQNITCSLRQDETSFIPIT
jgi:hypothetical protein